ncbi:NYN domain-containing protein [Nocardia callitridis]|uniref:NYN domain-containing protein n=1 Tax=Nocardia callitridis TaxID=648753 RepID=A0ABP9JXA2_9NOCA
MSVHAMDNDVSDVAGAPHGNEPGGVGIDSPSAEVLPSTTPDLRRVLLVWDAPNLDMGLGAILGGRPTAAYRPRFDALGRWLLARTAELSKNSTERIEPEATVFTNIAPGTADVVRPWVEALRNVGYAVFAKPKIDEDSDVDADMLAHIAHRSRAGGLAGIMVASADGQAFREPLEALAGQGIPAYVLGFREHASWAVTSDTLEFVDLEDIPGVFREPLPRVSLDSLPDEGAWLQPFRPLTALLTTRPAQGVA